MKSLFVSLFYSVVNPVNITHNAASAVLLAFLQKFIQCYTPEIFKSCSFQGFLACLQCIKPNTVFKIIFSFDVNQQSKKHENEETQYEFVSQ